MFILKFDQLSIFNDKINNMNKLLLSYYKQQILNILDISNLMNEDE